MKTKRPAPKRKPKHTTGSPAACQQRHCSPITDAVYPPEIIDREFAEQGRTYGWGTLYDMRECSRKLEYENAAMMLAITEFCKELEWACDEWKKQSHIAPLFKLANAKNQTPPPMA